MVCNKIGLMIYMLQVFNFQFWNMLSMIYDSNFFNKLGSRSLSSKLNSSSTQGSTHSVTWSLELVTIIAMPPPPTHPPLTTKLFWVKPMVEMSWEKNSKKKPIVFKNFRFLVNFFRHTGPMVTMVTTDDQVHRRPISASSSRNEFGKKV